VAGLAAAFGRGAMTNNWTDMANSTLFVVMGSNFVENHPAATAHVMRAYDRRPGVVQMIVIDPRKTRSAILAEAHGGRYIRFRPGTDIAFNNAVIGEIIRIFESADGIPAQVRDLYWQYLNDTGNLSLYRNDGVAESVPGNSLYTDARFIIRDGDSQDYVRSTDTSPGGFLDLPAKAATATGDPNTVYNRLKRHVAPYTPELAAEICGCTAEEITFVARAFVNHSRMMSSHLTGNAVVRGIQDPRHPDYRAAQMMYAMGLTQHTHGAQNVKGFATIQTLTGNVGRAGAAINALRGIHNVQGSTDQGVLQHLIPGYSGNPSQTRAANPNAFGRYADNLWGQPTRFPLDGSGNPTYGDAYGKTAAITAPGGGLQARGFYNMTLKWFGSYNAIHGLTEGSPARRAATDMIYDLWPKTDGDDHITMFRKMAQGQIKGCVVWGQNPAVTEPNQSAIREGLKQLDVLVVTDMFVNETAAADRKENSVTYLFPACSHVEEAGSVANSGRVLQWRERACPPMGNSRSDVELLMRFAYAVDKAGGFSHILDKWNAIVAEPTIGIATPWWSGYSTGPATPVFKQLYADQHAGGWNPANESFEAISATTEMWYSGKDAPETATVYGSEVVCESIYREMNAVPASGGTMWLYLDAYSTNPNTRLHTAAPNGGAAQAPWLVHNRSKSRATADPNGTYAFPGWGYSWLVNRRVLYNNTDVPGDIADTFMTPDSVARLFVPRYTAATRNYGAVGYANGRWRRVHGLSDMPDNATTSSIHTQGIPGRFTAHTEPYETPLENTAAGRTLLATFGRNTRGHSKWDLIHTGNSANGTAFRPTYVATNDVDYPVSHRRDPADYPLVLTTIRCVEHFQGGPITRNNPWNVEAEPTPWIEINSIDAWARGIKTGDMVNVITARSNSTSDQEGRTTGSAFAHGFIARVGVGAEDNQRVGRGVVAIPWHWGDKGLSTGSRANDLCIDSFDANTRIPEYKACLCEITKDLSKTPTDL
jgi:formate dehydrogenase major subunit